ncbi:MAG: hypothetical protein FWE63_06165 [Bacteroidales bacterium]|nr:hypothetical protein [Bacteroidales bacterium]
MKTIFKTLSIVFLTVLTMLGCKKKDFYLQNQPELSVLQPYFSLDMGVHVITIDVKSTRKWVIQELSDDNSWYRITPASMRGENNQTITVYVQSNNGAKRDLTLTISTSGGLSEQVFITQAGEFNSEVLLFEDFGTGATQTGTAWPSVADWDGFRKEGAGATNVTYTAEGGAVTIRSNSPSSGYLNASGNNNAMMAANGATLLVNNIDLMGMGRIQLSFGSNETNAILAVSFSTDGTNWEPIPYEKTTTTWGLVNTEFEVSGTTLFLRFSAAATQYGTRVDDIRVIGIGGGTTGSTLTLSPTTLNVGAGASTQTVFVTSNTTWTAISNAAWCTVTPTEGNESSTLGLSISANPSTSPRSTTITVKTDDDAVTRTLTVNQEGAEPGDLIYADDFGTNAVQSGEPPLWPLVEDYDDFNIRGSSAASIYYTSEGGAVTVRNNANSTGYPGASGGNNVMMAAAGASFIVNGIDTDGKPVMRLMFGTNETNSILSLSYSEDGGAWIQVPFVKTTSNWGLVDVEFDISPTTSLLRLKFTAATTQFGTRVDDLRLYGADEVSSRLTLSTTALNVTDAAGEYPVSVTSNTNWTASSNADWCTVSPTSGNGDGTLTISVTQNTDVARQATITVTTADGAVTQTLIVTQARAISGNVVASFDLTSLTGSTTPSVTASSGTGTIHRSVKGSNAAITITASNNTIYGSFGTGDAPAYWLITVPNVSQAVSRVNLSYETYGTAKSPRKWTIEVSKDNVTWESGDTYTLPSTATAATAAEGKEVGASFATPTTAGATLYIRILPDVTDLSIDGSPVGASNVNNRLMNSLEVSVE